MKLIPLYDRVIVKRLGAETKTASGLFIPDSAKAKQAQGVVMAVGHGRIDEKHQLHPLFVKVGQNVLFSADAGTEIKYENEELLILDEFEILAIVP
jgi:chaperonin GroES